MFRWVFILLLQVLASCQSVKYFVVRHAEKESVASGPVMATLNGPPLSAEGKIRALQLRDILKDQNIQYLYSTNTLRTLSTARPLQEWLGMVPVLFYNSKDSLDYFISQVKKIKNGNVLIVGHSNTVDDIVNKLCGGMKVPGDLPDSEYDNLYVVTKKGNTWKFKNKTFGSSTH